MTAVANLPSFQQNSRSAWNTNVSQGGLNAMNTDEVARMFMPRKSAQRTNSSSSISSIASTSSTSSTSTIAQAPQTNGVPMIPSGDLSTWGGTAAARKKPQRTGPWPAGKSEAVAGISIAKPQSILAPNGSTAASAMTSIHQPSAVVPSQHILQPPTQQMNGSGQPVQPVGEGNPVLYLLSMNGTFERKTISVPFYPDSLRIGRQTNAKTVPTPLNGFFDSKVLSRQHAEIWADRQGKVWIRDVKSSNGTFVNNTRLSAENRDSEPHELQTQDHLELGIDIVSEDQKTVVHHKVAAKVEHAGFLGATNNVLDMNFGDLDPANGAMMLPSQGSLQMRGRTNSVGSVTSNGRLGPPASLAGSQMSAMSQQRPMNFWLTPVTTEQIVKRLTEHEMRVARLQTHELGRTDNFFGSLLSKDDIKENQKEKAPVMEAPKAPQVNGGSVSFRSDVKPRFSDPPAPPPQQPLPEKPDVARLHNSDSPIPPLKRTNTERPRSLTSDSPVRQESTSQIVTLVEALASAKKEIDIQGARLRDLEEMLQKERHARENAEELARKFEQESESRANGEAKASDEGSIIEEAFEPPSETVEAKEELLADQVVKDNVVDPTAISESTLLLEKRLETMLLDMQELRAQMESFKCRAETAESERDTDRKTLAEMVEKIRADELSRIKSAEHSRVLSKVSSIEDLPSGVLEVIKPIESLPTKSTHSNVNAGPTDKELKASAVSTLSRAPGNPALYHATPYASMLGVVLIGMGLMTYLNGWQPPKVER
ncbi:related to VPS64 Vacuolar protein sorting [Rhynchosporium secalis]|uniref:Related to VPS64 Vacuolar protein sorting n=1 Tax=Rhynchosporium secalis TaxID=38038 RepID=A0A1E1M9C0_RHYSE|nr:related to VPS64 Vacuolar protein sorting [Rhynchosporium secalis]